MTVWRVRWEPFLSRSQQIVQFEGGGLEALLNAGWEPFAATENGVMRVWLRKLVELDD